MSGRKGKKNRWIQGSITILLVVILVPVMSFAAIIVDTSRINMGKAMVSSAGDLAMNAALSDYDTVLKDVYGLFAISQTDEDLANNIQKYFEKTLVSYGATSEAEAGEYTQALLGNFHELIESGGEGFSANNFMKMEMVKPAELEKLEDSALSNPNILRAQIVEQMKYRAPINFGLSFLDSLNCFKTVESQTKVIQKETAAQEKTQDVTQVCSDLAELIREYDKYIDTILKDGENAVTGLNASNLSGDQTYVEEGKNILAYPDQIKKYKDKWGSQVSSGVRRESYKHINQLNLIYLVDAPDDDKLWLKKLGNDAYIDNTPKVKYDKSGVDAPSAGELSANDVAGALTKLDQQIQFLNNSGSLASKTKSKYVGSNMLDPYKLTTSSPWKFADGGESGGTDSYIVFRQMIANTHSTIKYDDVKDTLKQIYKLGKLYDGFEKKKDEEIKEKKKVESEKKSVYDSAAAKKRTADSNKSQAENEISSSKATINSNNSSNKNDYNAKKDKSETFLQIVSEQAKDQTVESTIKGFWGENITSNSLGQFNAGSDGKSNKYRSKMKSLAEDDDLKTAFSDICEKTSKFLDANSSTKNYERYMKNAAGSNWSTWKKDSLYKLMKYLATNAEAVEKMAAGLSAKSTCDAACTQANAAFSEAKGEYDSASADRQKSENEKAETKGRFEACLSSYKTFTDEYQRDLKYFSRYEDAAKAEIERDAGVISEQYNKIKNNIKGIIDYLDKIDKKIGNKNKSGTLIREIREYKTKVAEWKQENNNYKNQTKIQSDSFLTQSQERAEATENEYSLEAAEKLQTYVKTTREVYNDFYNCLNGGSIKYGNKTIASLTTAKNIMKAAKSAVSFSGMAVTRSDADGKFAELYKTEGSIPSLQDAENYNDFKFFNPNVMALSFLQFLNSTFPEEKEETASPSGGSSEQKVSQEDKEEKKKYESLKKNLSSDSGSSVDEEGAAASSGYGYSYDGKSAGGSLPSDNKKKNNKKQSETKFKTQTSGKKINASNALGKQASLLNSMLSGLGRLGEFSLENIYIMDYLFENFSYNTCIQEKIIEGKGIESKFANISSVQSNQASYLDSLKNMRGYTINQNDNYLYGAELEYILFGNKAAKKNVTAMKGWIYALRFAFNCIYAFTNSEIRNTARSIGLAVQAASLGIIPYMVVQIVVQLAIAAAESAIDLSMISSGMKVAVVKNNDTWNLSISSAVDQLADVVKTKAADMAEYVTATAVNKATEGIQGVVDASADKLGESLKDLSDNLTEAGRTKLQEGLDEIFAIVQSQMENTLHELTSTQYAKIKMAGGDIPGLSESPKAYAQKKFDELKISVAGSIDAMAASSSNEIIKKVAGDSRVKDKVYSVIDKISTKVTSQLPDSTGDEELKRAGEKMSGQIADFQKEVNKQIKDAVTSLNKSLKNTIDGMVNAGKASLDSYIAQKGNDISETASKEVKEKVSEMTNEFSNKYLEDAKSAASKKTIGSGLNLSKDKSSITSNKSSSSAIASAVKFGYKDYLKIFLFLDLLINDESALARTGDLIQLNIQHANGSGTQSGGKKFYSHKAKENFMMSKACTYVSVKADVKLNMLFINMDFFQRSLDGSKTEIEGQWTSAATMKYRGLNGY